ncbi:MAG: hypothetical protein WCE80_15045 [Acidimicrobiia bacterium]
MSSPTSQSSLVATFLNPRRGTVLAIAFASASISTHPLLWVFLPFALLLLVVSPKSDQLSRPATAKFTLLAAMVVWLFTVPHGPLSLFSATLWLPETSAWVTVGALTVLAAAYAMRNLSDRWRTALWVLVAVWVVLAGLASILADPETWIDVWALHHGAGSALVHGASPYSGLSVPNPMSQFPEGSVYGGYVYPPIPLFTFALTDAITGDSRWFALLCGVGLVWIFRRLSVSRDTDALSILFLVAPGWPLMVQLSWTEPLSVLLLGLAVLGRPGSRARSLILGAFVASKQYLLLTALPITASWMRRRRAALILAGTTTLVLYALGLIFGPSSYLQWAFLFHLQVPPPPLGENLPGLAELLLGIKFSIPSAVALLAGALAGSWVAWRKPRSDASMLLGMATSLAVIFFFGYQAFPNYWYGTLGVFVLGILTHRRDESFPPDPQPARPSTDSLQTT